MADEGTMDSYAINVNKILIDGIPISTDNIIEGSNNIYFTTSRSRDSISLVSNNLISSISYTNTTGILKIPVVDSQATASSIVIRDNNADCSFNVINSNSIQSTNLLNSTSKLNGSVIIAGGIGVGKDINASNIFIDNQPYILNKPMTNNIIVQSLTFPTYSNTTTTYTVVPNMNIVIYPRYLSSNIHLSMSFVGFCNTKSSSAYWTIYRKINNATAIELTINNVSPTQGFFISNSIQCSIYFEIIDVPNTLLKCEYFLYGRSVSGAGGSLIKACGVGQFSYFKALEILT